MGTDQSRMGSLFKWLFFPHKDDLKHKSWAHPIFSLFVAIANSLATSEYLSQTIGKPPTAGNIPDGLRYKSGTFLLIYYLIMVLTRLRIQKSRVFYDMMWACNISMLLAIYSLFKNDSILLGSSIVIIAIDQLLWYVDCLGYLIFKKFKVGVAGYLVWPEIHIIQKITSTHHLWFIPLIGYILKQSGGFEKEAYIIAAIVTTILWCVSRLLVPKTISDENNKKHPEVYMNVNLSWELWKDVKISWLKKLTADAPFFRSMFFTTLIWNLLNLVCYLLLKWVFQAEPLKGEL